MTPILGFLANQGPMLLLGITLILTCAAIAIALHNQPIHRQRLAEAAMLLCILFIILALIPLPRFSFETKSVPAEPSPKYTLQPGDEIIAAEVFKYPRSQELRNLDSNIPISTATKSLPRSVPKTPINWSIILSTLYLAGVIS